MRFNSSCILFLFVVGYPRYIGNAHLGISSTYFLSNNIRIYIDSIFHPFMMEYFRSNRSLTRAIGSGDNNKHRFVQKSIHHFIF